MNDSLLGTLLLPLAVAVIMFGLGLSLTLNDFGRAIRRPRIVLIALVCQFVVVPLIGIALILTIPLEPAVAVGVMLLVATPGGTLANMYSHLCGADVALNLTLTAITSVISAFTIPLFINVSASYLMGDGPGIGIQAGELPQVMGIVLVRVVLGMLTRRLIPRFAERATKPVKVLSIITLATAVTAAIVSEWEGLSEAFAVVGLVVTVLLAASLAVAYVVPRLFKVPERQAVAVSFEIGLHNTPLAIAIAMSPHILNDTKMAFAPATYSIVAIIGGGVFAYVMSKRLAASELIASRHPLLRYRPGGRGAGPVPARHGRGQRLPSRGRIPARPHREVDAIRPDGARHRRRADHRDHRLPAAQPVPAVRPARPAAAVDVIAATLACPPPPGRNCHLASLPGMHPVMST